MEQFLPFERPIKEVEQSVRRLAWRVGREQRESLSLFRKTLRKRDKARKKIYGNLSAWQRVQLARHPRRPHGRLAAETLFGRLETFRGDRSLGDDPAIVTGLGQWRGATVGVIACERGAGQVENRRCNFGMPGPSGFRKAQRLVRYATRNKIPVVSIVDTPGAYPGVESEFYGVAEAISSTFLQRARAKTPILGIVLGEGGSGGALALAMADRIIMMQNAYFSVISPEACASILWRDGSKTEAAAESLKLLPEDLLGLGIIDEVVPEPEGGAHRYPVESLCTLRAYVDRHLEDITQEAEDTLLEKRYMRYRHFMGDTWNA